MPIATTLLGKSVISEAHPLFGGVYEGAMGRPEVTELVESADCLLMLGCFMTDINLGIWTAKLDPSKCIDATSEDLRIKRHHYQDVRLDDFIRGLIDRKLKVCANARAARAVIRSRSSDRPRPIERLTSARLFARLNQMLAEYSDMTVIADIGDSLFGAADLEMHRHTEFLSPAYYTSMGFGVPAAVGASMANPKARILVIVGDGAFQMTGMELSTIARHGLNPIVVVLNNHGYTTERFLLEGPFNDIQDWAYHKVPAVVGAGLGLEVKTVGELDSALRAAQDEPGQLQPDQRPSRSLRPQPGPRTSGPEAVANRHVVVRRQSTGRGPRRCEARTEPSLQSAGGEAPSDSLLAAVSRRLNGAGCRRTLWSCLERHDARHITHLGGLVGPGVDLLSDGMPRD